MQKAIIEFIKKHGIPQKGNPGIFEMKIEKGISPKCILESIEYDTLYNSLSFRLNFLDTMSEAFATEKFSYEELEDSEKEAIFDYIFEKETKNDTLNDIVTSLQEIEKTIHNLIEKLIRKNH
jgi:hypothetical protein